VLRQFEEQQIAPALENLVTNDSFLSLLSKPQRLAVARHCKAKSYKAGELIFEYGSLADEVHILLKGEVQVLNENNEKLAELNQGACYGERSFLKESPHLATIRAVSDSEVASISFDELKALERLRPDIGLLLYKALAKELSGKM
jgi:CRP-like cAMP-binding protein